MPEGGVGHWGPVQTVQLTALQCWWPPATWLRTQSVTEKTPQKQPRALSGSQSAPQSRLHPLRSNHCRMGTLESTPKQTPCRAKGPGHRGPGTSPEPVLAERCGAQAQEHLQEIARDSLQAERP